MLVLRSEKEIVEVVGGAGEVFGFCPWFKTCIDELLIVVVLIFSFFLKGAKN